MRDDPYNPDPITSEGDRIELPRTRYTQPEAERRKPTMNKFNANVVDAMAMWEAVIDPDPELEAITAPLFEAHGTMTMRDAVARMQPMCSAAFTPGTESFDWDHCPRWLLTAPWSDALALVESGQ